MQVRPFSFGVKETESFSYEAISLINTFVLACVLLFIINKSDVSRSVSLECVLLFIINKSDVSRSVSLECVLFFYN